MTAIVVQPVEVPVSLLKIYPYLSTALYGAGFVAGTVKELPKGAVAGGEVAVSRKVRLVREYDNLLVRETWSNALTGAYRFDYIPLGWTYYVISFDHSGTFQMVAADRLVPEGY